MSLESFGGGVDFDHFLYQKDVGLCRLDDGLGDPENGLYSGHPGRQHCDRFVVHGSMVIVTVTLLLVAKAGVFSYLTGIFISETLQLLFETPVFPMETHVT